MADHNGDGKVDQAHSQTLALMDASGSAPKQDTSVLAEIIWHLETRASRVPREHCWAHVDADKMASVLEALRPLGIKQDKDWPTLEVTECAGEWFELVISAPGGIRNLEEALAPHGKSIIRSAPVHGPGQGAASPAAGARPVAG
ncbi:MAG: hypothetical protein M3O22_04875 [Pseudomonadota bacterium]|nr:hypothetical protein [Pseudomonadota bacterium]